MIVDFLKKVFGTKQSRDLKAMRPLLQKVNALASVMQAKTDAELQEQTVLLKQKLAEGQSLDSILPEAFASLREASKRVLGLYPFDVQILGGIALHQGKIAEMKTGEGKTLTATLPLYLNALTGNGCHLVTVNDYLAQRDGHEMGKLYQFMGLSVGIIISDMEDEDRQKAYNSDITYGTNNELAFDYLRDNMKFNLADYVQRVHHFCIVDEVDSILIDEARTPLLISGPSEGDISLYSKISQLIPKLKKEEDFTLDEKSKTGILTDAGVNKVQKLLQVGNLYEVKHAEILHNIHQSLRAHHLFVRDVDYVVKEGKVIIVDEFTGRLKTGSRWSDGLHQAVEAKEGVTIKRENQTLASITFQNYFKLYQKLSGMTGTADTEAEEFRKIYNLDVIVIPTNLPMVREDRPDVIYKNKKGKYKAVANLIAELHQKGQPVLVGTISIESSELISQYLKGMNVAHEVLNAKQHEREALIVANAGQPKAVTIATNMAGRGTDIKLTEETVKLGGLFILGTERHESRRIDNQLRGRSGRQGDPGASKFFISLEDDLMRIFGSDRLSSMMNTLGMEEDEPIEHKMISNAIAKAQKKVEAHNFDIRKHLLDYDNVMNKQRKLIYNLRRDILTNHDNFQLTYDFIEDVICDLVTELTPEDSKSIESFPWDKINQSFHLLVNQPIELSIDECIKNYDQDIEKYLYEKAKLILDEKFVVHDKTKVANTLREVLLATLDTQWKDHLLNMDHLKEGINLRAYAQKDPLNEYKRDAFTLFEQMRASVKKSFMQNIFAIHIYTDEEIEEIKRQQNALLKAQLEAHQRQQEAQVTKEPSSSQPPKPGRNNPCPCGSGKKYKHCHGK